MEVEVEVEARGESLEASWRRERREFGGEERVWRWRWRREVEVWR